VGCPIYKLTGFYLSRKILSSEIPNHHQTILYIFKNIWKKGKVVCLRRLHEFKLRRHGNKPQKVTKMNIVYKIRGPGPNRTKYTLNPQHYECPEGNAILVISRERHKIRVLLASGSNIFLLTQNTACTVKVPNEIRENPLKITAFNGEVSSTGGKYYSHPIQLEMGPNGHTTMVSCEIADPGKHDMIIPFGWWHNEHPMKSIETPEKWCFENSKCVGHVQDDGIADMCEWDETVAFEEEARMIGRIGATRHEDVQLE